jgi:hypothetical protein
MPIAIKYQGDKAFNKPLSLNIKSTLRTCTLNLSRLFTVRISSIKLTVPDTRTAAKR